MVELNHTVYTIDIQGFSLGSEFMVKELGICDGEIIKHFHFKPKCLFRELDVKCKREARWVENNHHGIPFNSGTSDYKDLNEILLRETEKADTIFCKGHQKFNFLKPILGDKIFQKLGDDDDEMPCNFYPEKPLCKNHKLEICICSINNCIKLYKSIFF